MNTLAQWSEQAITAGLVLVAIFAAFVAAFGHWAIKLAVLAWFLFP